MIFFAIPLRSKYSSRNWDSVVNCFNNTLSSIYNQTSGNFKILVAGHDDPEISVFTDHRYEFFQVDYPSPLNFNEQMLDKYYKKRYLMKKIRDYGSGFVMFVDADDYVSNRLTSFIDNNEDSHGYYFSQGFEYNFSNKKIQIAPRFYRLCGTSYIIRYFDDDLPNKFVFNGYSYKADERPNDYIFDHSHIKWIEILKKLHRPLKALPFPGALYTINTGDNHSILSGNVSMKRKLLRLMIPSVTPDKSFMREFCL